MEINKNLALVMGVNTSKTKWIFLGRPGEVIHPVKQFQYTYEIFHPKFLAVRRHPCSVH